MRKHYSVAGHGFVVDAEEAIFADMDQYQPFMDEPSDDKFTGTGNTLFTLHVHEAVTPIIYIEHYRQEEEGQAIMSGKTSDGNTVLEFRLNDKVAGWLVCAPGYKEGDAYYKDRHSKFVVNNALMMMYTFTTSDKQTALFHSSVVSLQGRAYMFLGKSGTGKSTHSQLWLKYLEGTELVNDDNPVVRITDGEARVYGSPWSGKTPCYRNIDYPIGGIVKLEQAPYNRIRRLNAIEAYIALTMSISGMRWEKRMGDGLHATENQLAASVPVWHLSCLPDQDAAELCHTAIAAQD